MKDLKEHYRNRVRGVVTCREHHTNNVNENRAYQFTSLQVLKWWCPGSGHETIELQRKFNNSNDCDKVDGSGRS